MSEANLILSASRRACPLQRTERQSQPKSLPYGPSFSSAQRRPAGPTPPRLTELKLCLYENAP